MFWFSVVLNSLIAGICLAYLDITKTCFLCFLIIAIESLVLKDVPAAVALVMFTANQAREYLLPYPLISDIGITALIYTSIGLWVGVGIERNLSGGTIRLHVIAFALVALLFPTHQAPGQTILTTLNTFSFLYSYHTLAYIKLKLEDEVPPTFLPLSTVWTLVSPSTIFFYLLRVMFMLLLTRAFVPLVDFTFFAMSETDQSSTSAEPTKIVGIPRKRQPKQVYMEEPLLRAMLRQAYKKNTIKKKEIDPVVLQDEQNMDF